MKDLSQEKALDSHSATYVSLRLLFSTIVLAGQQCLVMGALKKVTQEAGYKKQQAEKILGDKFDPKVIMSENESWNNTTEIDYIKYHNWCV